MKCRPRDRARPGRAVHLSRMMPVELAPLAARLPARPLTRFAPSPTGYLHLGHVANAVWTWGIARALGGRVLLRLEDHDRGRCRPEYEAALLEDLEWLGLEPDVGASRTSFVPAGPRTARATPATPTRARSLGWGRGSSPATCSRKDLARGGGDVVNEETRYDGRCRDRGLTAGPGSRAPAPAGSRARALRRRPARRAGAGSLGPMRRPAAARPAGALDLPPGRGGGRPPARRGPGGPGGGPARVHRPPDPARPAPRAGGAAGLPASSADPEAGRREAQQVER